MQLKGANVFFMVTETYRFSNFTCKSMSCKNVKIVSFKFVKEKRPKKNKVEVNEGLFAVISIITNFDLLSFHMCLFLRNIGNTGNGKATVRCYFSFHLQMFTNFC